MIVALTLLGLLIGGWIVQDGGFGLMLVLIAVIPLAMLVPFIAILEERRFLSGRNR